MATDSREPPRRADPRPDARRGCRATRAPWEDRRRTGRHGHTHGHQGRQQDAALHRTAHGRALRGGCLGDALPLPGAAGRARPARAGGARVPAGGAPRRRPVLRAVGPDPHPHLPHQDGAGHHVGAHAALLVAAPRAHLARALRHAQRRRPRGARAGAVRLERRDAEGLAQPGRLPQAGAADPRVGPRPAARLELPRLVAVDGVAGLPALPAAGPRALALPRAALDALAVRRVGRRARSRCSGTARPTSATRTTSRDWGSTIRILTEFTAGVDHVPRSCVRLWSATADGPKAARRAARHHAVGRAADRHRDHGAWCSATCRALQWTVERPARTPRTPPTCRRSTTCSLVPMLILWIGALALTSRGPSQFLSRDRLILGGYISFSLYMVHTVWYGLWRAIMRAAGIDRRPALRARASSASSSARSCSRGSCGASSRSRPASGCARRSGERPKPVEELALESDAALTTATPPGGSLLGRAPRLERMTVRLATYNLLHGDDRARRGARSPPATRPDGPSARPWSTTTGRCATPSPCSTPTSSACRRSTSTSRAARGTHQVRSVAEAIERRPLALRAVGLRHPRRGRVGARHGRPRGGRPTRGCGRPRQDASAARTTPTSRSTRPWRSARCTASASCRDCP